eukprot:m.83605 g.83605  ORF g.83605 m.83605 type:complete len:264 (+) comp12725_c0_seq1:1625-2416(+)
MLCTACAACSLVVLRLPALLSLSLHFSNSRHSTHTHTHMCSHIHMRAPPPRPLIPNTRYKDPFKERPGVDKPWSRPTHLNPKVLRDKRFVTPSALANALTNNWQEVAYMPSLLEECCVDGVGRSQYCLLKHHISDQFPSTIKTSAVITALAGITTHLPITVVFRVGDDNDNMPHFVATSTQQQSKGHFFVPSSQYQPIEVEPATPKQKDPHKHLSQRQTNVGVVAVGTEQTMPVIIADLDSDEETDSDDQDEASTTFLDISEV